MHIPLKQHTEGNYINLNDTATFSVECSNMAGFRAGRWRCVLPMIYEE